MSKIQKYLYQQTSIAPLISFRILFGAIMAISIFRFYYKGWIHDLYVNPIFYFSYYGFDWVKPFGEQGMYITFFLLFLSSIGIMLGAFYRASSLLFFLLFTYVELIDKTNYLNHYYFVSIMAGLLVLVPAHRAFSIDVWHRGVAKLKSVPAWVINVFKLQLGFVYFFAGIAKLTPSWLIDAMPLKLWLPALAHTPIIGGILEQEWLAYAFSWSGAIYDLSIAFLLLMPRTRLPAYFAVVIFHLMTALLFQIGMFPYIMILCTLIFFSANFHERVLSYLGASFDYSSELLLQAFQKPKLILLAIFFAIQLFLPFRHLMYTGDLYWTEQGYRFSWRVMLMEKAGHTTFKVEDIDNNKIEYVNNSDFLVPQQIKMMSTQADMILQFAHYLRDHYLSKGWERCKVTCQSKVTLNGKRSSLLIDPTVDLALEKRGWHHKKWILPQEN